MDNSRIKFRAWHKEEKKMYEVSSIDFTNEEITVWVASGKFLWFDFEDIEVMQWTGAKDIAETLIYEGDVVESKRFFGIPAVDGKPMNKSIRVFCVEWEGNTNSYGLDFTPAGLVVIGNKYQNPDLLTDG